MVELVPDFGMYSISCTCTATSVVSYTMIITEYAYMLLFLPFFCLMHLCTFAHSMHTVCTIAVWHVNIVQPKKPFYYGCFVYM